LAERELVAATSPEAATTSASSVTPVGNQRRHGRVRGG
jgi:hypothetical protein